MQNFLSIIDLQEKNGVLYNIVNIFHCFSETRSLLMKLDHSSIAFILLCSGLVFLMTPALAFFMVD